MNNIKKVLICLTTLIVLIIIIICLLIVISKQKEKKEDQQLIEESFDFNNKLEKVSSFNDYMFIKECINKYINYSENIRDLTDNDDSITIEETKNQLKSIIPRFVREELQIKDEDLYEKIGIVNKTFRLNNIYKSLQTINEVAYEENTSIHAYYVEGILINKSNYEKEDMKMLIILDKINETFLVIPQIYIENKNIKINEGEQLEIYKQETIEDNVYNVFYKREVSEDEICQNYLLELKNNLMYDIEYVYNNILDSQYRNSKFENVEQFKEYVKQNYANINKIAVNKYNVEQEENYKKYICLDKDEEIYIFYEKGIMDYSLIMDTYTIDFDDFIKKYNAGNDATKVGMNIEKIVEAINHKDYQYVYKHLDETYKNNNFPNLEQFEDFIKDKFYDKNEIKYIEFDEYGNTYVYNINILNKQNNELYNNINIIMKLEEGTDFVMSIGI